MNLFVKNLRYFRRKRGLSQKEFSKTIGINRSTFAAYEEGRAEPTIKNYLLICEFFGYDPSYFYDFDLVSFDKINNPPNKVNKLK